MEKYKLSGMMPAAGDAMHFKAMALDHDFERVRATAPPFVRCSVGLQMPHKTMPPSPTEMDFTILISYPPALTLFVMQVVWLSV